MYCLTPRYCECTGSMTRQNPEQCSHNTRTLLFLPQYSTLLPTAGSTSCVRAHQVPLPGMIKRTYWYSYKIRVSVRVTAGPTQMPSHALNHESMPKMPSVHGSNSHPHGEREFSSFSNQNISWATGPVLSKLLCDPSVARFEAWHGARNGDRTHAPCFVAQQAVQQFSSNACGRYLTGEVNKEQRRCFCAAKTKDASYTAASHKPNQRLFQETHQRTLPSPV